MMLLWSSRNAYEMRVSDAYELNEDPNYPELTVFIFFNVEKIILEREREKEIGDSYSFHYLLEWPYKEGGNRTFCF